MDEGAVTKAIEGLEHVRKRPTMSLGTSSEPAVQLFLMGFRSACQAIGWPITLELRREATWKRGWGFPAVGPAGEMRERGYTEAQVVEELLMIEITTLQMLLTPPE
jgi:hypothetical protein